MILKQCYLIANKCFIANQKAQMTGIVVHDTAGGNVNLKRYVQPVPSQSNYNEVITDLGVNLNGNHWNGIIRGNGKERFACVHAFIGKNAKGEIETYQTLPYDIACWGVGEGNKGSYNFPPDARIQFEICDDGYRSEAYFNAAMKEAQEYCAYLCKLYGWNADKICCHYEAYQRGCGGNHNDIIPWLTKFGKTMDWFRNEVQKLIDKGDDEMTEAEIRAIVADEFAKQNEKATQGEKVYHYWSEIDKELNWALKPLIAMYKKGYFVGASASDLSLKRSKVEIIVILAKILESLEIIKYPTDAEVKKFLGI